MKVVGQHEAVSEHGEPTGELTISAIEGYDEGIRFQIPEANKLEFIHGTLLNVEITPIIKPAHEVVQSAGAGEA